MLNGDTLKTSEEGETVTSHVSGTGRLRGGSENTPFAGFSRPEVLLFLIFPLKRVIVDIGGSVQGPLPATEAWHRELPTTTQKGASCKKGPDWIWNEAGGKRCPPHPRWALC